MVEHTDETLNVRVKTYRSWKRDCCYRQRAWGLVKVVSMKLPVVLKALPKRTGLKESPKDICKDRNIGTWKSWNMERIATRRSVDTEN